MKRSSARNRCFCPNFFSTDKHWVFILLIASNFVLFSLVFIILNQEDASPSTYEPVKVRDQISLAPSRPVSLTVTPTLVPIPTFNNTISEIKRISALPFSSRLPLSLNQQGINSFVSDEIYFYDDEVKKTIYFSFQLSSYEYVPGTKMTHTVSGKKYTVDFDKWVKWLSGINVGTQDSLVYSDLGPDSKVTSVTGKKIGSYIFFVHDYKKNGGWVREYFTYDAGKKQITKIAVNTSEPGGFSQMSLNLFNQIESAISTAN